jgi:CRP-like cAMP-binding protein
MFTVRSGLVKLVQYLPDGTQRIVRLLNQGDVAGLEAVLGNDYQHTAMILEPTSVCRIPVSIIARLNQQTPRMHRQLMTRWQKALSEADAWLTELSTGTAKERVARLLIRQAEATGEEGFHLLGREDIGAMLGITTETASRVIADFKRSGLIRTGDGGRVHADLDGLESIAMN